MIKQTDTLYDTVKTYPKIKEYLVGQGIQQAEDEQALEKMGRMLTLDMVAKSKKLNTTLFIDALNQWIMEKDTQVDTTLFQRAHKKNATIDIQGVLPCPVRLPLLESFETWLFEQPLAYQKEVDYELKAASMGVDWLKEDLIKSEKETELADVFVSAGFDVFFDQRLMGRYKEQKTFQDMVQWDEYNRDFREPFVCLKDPERDYSILGVVPAIFLVNTERLGERSMPTTWAELLTGEFDNQVSLPVGEFDLFNAILLNVYKNHGMEGVRKLGKTLMKSMHPAEMVKSNIQKEQPLVTIMPYFFTKMVHERSPMKAVWPHDGAIISPIFMLSKRSKREMLQPIINFFSSKEVGEILSHNGRFPSTHPEVDNQIGNEKTYQWLGWSFIQSHDIGALIEACMIEFNGGA